MNLETNEVNPNDQDISRGRIEKKRNRTKVILSNSCITISILSYFGKMKDIDSLMRIFSNRSRAIWIYTLGKWLNIFEESLEDIKITPDNIKLLIKHPPLSNCRLHFTDYNISTDKYKNLIIRFVNKVYSKNQIKSINIEDSGRKEFKNIAKEVIIEKVFKNLEDISKKLDHMPSGRKSLTESSKTYSVYFSDIFSARKDYGIINSKLMIFPKVIQESKILYIDSDYILDNDSIRVRKIDEDEFPFICNLKFEDPNIPIFDHVKRVKLYENRDDNRLSITKINTIIKRCYPNLKELTLADDRFNIGKYTYKLCGIIESTNTKFERREKEITLKAPIIFKAKNAIVARTKYIGDEEKHECIYKCTIEVVVNDFIEKEGYIYILKCYPLSISNCLKVKELPYLINLSCRTIRMLKKFKYDSIAIQWVILCADSITSVSPTYHSCFNARFSSFSLKGFLPRYLTSYNSFPSCTSFHITCCNPEPIFSLYQLYSEIFCELNFLYPSANRYNIDVVEIPFHLPFKGLFSKNFVEKFKGFRLVLLVKHTHISSEKQKEIEQILIKWTRLGNCTGVVVRGYEETRYKDILFCVNKKEVTSQVRNIIKTGMRSKEIGMGVPLVIE
ncbi:unnamed protein product [Moneuplotes crassus]|uniref:Uncharacterized protein n=1 Tax=Euplotes crassus TaxID=5936 RepID=A0AAD2DA36_EUPCR|nr:unnamed protein product [Moneuplotes crassus]